MKSVKFIISSVIAILATSFSVEACWIPSYSPSEYLMYSPLYNEESAGNDNLNCLLWQKQTSESIPVEDIKKVVYKYSVEGVASILSDSLESKNKFVQWIVAYREKDIVDFLVLAKRCEDLREDRWSPWYYPSKKDSTKYNLQRVASEAIEYDEERFKSRYALQAVRALHSLGKYDECCDFWAKNERAIPDDVVKSMAKDYVAGCEFRRGNKQKAREMYAELDQWMAVLDCMDSIPNRPYAKVEIGLEYAPNSKSIQNYVNKKIRLLDVNGFVSWRWDSDSLETRNGYRALLDICSKTANNSKVKDKAFWWYSAAFLADKFEKLPEAVKYISMAEKTCTNSVFLERIKVMSIYLQAKTRSYSGNVDNWLHNQLLWFMKLIKRDAYDGDSMMTCSLYGLTRNYSFYYWNDMMRKIVLGEVCPRLIEKGKHVRALQLANFADNVLLNYTKKVKCWMDDKYETINIDLYRETTKENEYDFSNESFWMMDSIGVDNIVKYVKVLNNPQTEFDYFLAKGSYVDDDYFNDIIGTQMLRNMRYAEAVKYLGAVRHGYQRRLNTKWYLDIDPFSYKWRSRKKTYDAKYEFAVKMNTIEQSLKTIEDPNRKAELMLQFALGLKKSFDEAWALTYYFKGENYYWRGKTTLVENRKETINALKRAEDMEKTAFAMFTDDEVAAYAHSQYMGHYNIIAERYSHTQIAKQMLSTCDNYKDYLVTHKKRF